MENVEPSIMLMKTDQPNEMMLNMGPQHPSTHGVCRLLIKLDGEKAVKIEPIIGYMHRGVEKLAENRDYTQFVTLSDRLDWTASISNNMAYSLAVEDLIGVKVPERAEYIRVIMLELQRLASHFIFVASSGLDVGAWGPMMYGFRDREKVLDLIEMVTGARITSSYIFPGGVRYDLPQGFAEKCNNTMKVLSNLLNNDYDTYFYTNEIFLKRCEGVGKLKAEDAINLGATGPILRACGVPYDLRKIDSYSVYDRMDFKVCTEKEGDVLARFKVRLNEMKESIKIITQALKDLPEGETKAKVPRPIKPPKGETYSRVEGPRGEFGIYLVSDGASKNPYRLKIRSPSFCNLSAFPAFAEGLIVADIIPNFSSIDIVLGDVDR